MRVILLRDSKGIGKKFDVKDVKDGYARNFLIPHGLAMVADKVSLDEINRYKAKKADDEKNVRARLGAMAKKLENERFIFSVRAGAKSEVFGSIGSRDIEERIKKVAENENDLDNLEVMMDQPLKSLGEREIRVNLGHGITVAVPVMLEAIKESRR
ncbi:50S ribosomal protein L9 [Candidatus Wolfebacteria bacterium]|nr:50S ribosomal protein L9 [Candidatus Wolfebacteria bacterium]